MDILGIHILRRNHDLVLIKTVVQYIGIYLTNERERMVEDARNSKGQFEKGHTHSLEVRRKISIATREAMKDPERRRKNSEAQKGKVPWNKGLKGVQVAWNNGLEGFLKGRIVSEKTRRKQSEGIKKAFENEGVRKKRSDAQKRCWQDPKYRVNKIAAMTGIRRSKESREKMSKAHKGKKLSLSESEIKRRTNILHGNGDPIRRSEISKKISIIKTGKHPSEKTIKNLIESHIGGFWYGNIRYYDEKLYCEKWTEEFKERIRAFFNYICLECGNPQNGISLHCHHVYYDKKACCAINENGEYFSNLGMKGNPHNFKIIGDPNKFVVLCNSCHGRSTGRKNREQWARYYEETINNYYQGKSYLTKEEMKVYLLK